MRDESKVTFNNCVRIYTEEEQKFLKEFNTGNNVAYNFTEKPHILNKDPYYDPSCPNLLTKDKP